MAGSNGSGALKDFGSGAPTEVVAFRLCGEDFHVTTDAPALALMRLSKAGEASGDAGAMKAMVDFVVEVLNDGEGERFAELLDRERVGVALLTEVVQWVVETVTGRPTSPPSVSPSAPAKVGTSSTGASSSPASPAA